MQLSPGALRRLRGVRSAASQRLLRRAVLGIGLIAIVLVTVDPMRDRMEMTLDLVLWAAAAAFAVDWGLRLWEARRTRGGLLAYQSSVRGIVDAMAALAVPFAFALGAGYPEGWVAGAVWALKPAAVSPGVVHLLQGIAAERRSLSSVGAVFLLLLFVAGAAMHLAEGEAQPEQFGSLPATLWWSVITLTGGAVGSQPPVTPAGKLIASVVMAVGLGVFGLVTGILANGFASQARREDLLRAWDLVARASLFQTLGPGGIADVATTLRRWEVAEGTVIFRRGRIGDSMYFVAAGEVEVELPTGNIRLGEGNLFGEMALLERGGTRSATITTTKATTLLVLDLPDFLALAARHPELAAAIEAEAARRRADNLSAQGDT